MCLYRVFAFKTRVFSSIMIYLLLQTGVQKQHIGQFWTAIDHKIAILEVGNGVKVIADLHKIYEWVMDGLRMGYRKHIAVYPNKVKLNF